MLSIKIIFSQKYVEKLIYMYFSKGIKILRVSCTLIVGNGKEGRQTSKQQTTRLKFTLVGL